MGGPAAPPAPARSARRPASTPRTSASPGLGGGPANFPPLPQREGRGEGESPAPRPSPAGRGGPPQSRLPGDHYVVGGYQAQRRHRFHQPLGRSRQRHQAGRHEVRNQPEPTP